MSSRSAMDRPATVVVALLGVALIAVSLPFLAGSEAESTTYNVAWTQVAIGADDEAFAGNGQTATVTLPADGLLSNITVLMVSCGDNRPAPQLQPEAQITWSLTANGVAVDNGNASCTEGDVQRIAVGGHPDVGSTKADSAEAALDSLYGRRGFENTTVTYVLTFGYTRADSATSPLPAGNPTFAGRMGLEAEGWKATVTVPEEVVR